MVIVCADHGNFPEFCESTELRLRRTLNAIPGVILKLKKSQIRAHPRPTICAERTRKREPVLRPVSGNVRKMHVLVVSTRLLHCNYPRAQTGTPCINNPPVYSSP